MIRSKLPAKVLAFCVGVALMFLGACGSDKKSSSVDDSAPTTAAALSKADYVSQANSLCRELAEGPEQPDPATSAEAIVQLKKLITDFEAMQEKLRALRAPTADEKDIVANFISGNDAQIVALKEGLTAAEKLPASASVADVEAAIDPAFVKYATIAEAQHDFGTRYGLTDCVD